MKGFTGIVFGAIVLCIACSDPDDTGTEPPSMLPAEVEFAWEIDTIRLKGSIFISIRDVTAYGSSAYIGSIDAENQGSFLQYLDGTWSKIPETWELGLSGRVSDIDIAENGDMLVVGGYWLEKIALQRAGLWRLLDTELMDSYIRCCHLGRSGTVYIGCDQGVLCMRDTTWSWEINFRDVLKTTDTLDRIEASAVCMGRNDETLYAIATLRDASNTGGRYLISVVDGVTTIVDSVGYPEPHDAISMFGYDLFEIDGDVYSCRRGIYRISNQTITEVTRDVLGVWMTGSAHDGGLFIASGNEVYRYDGTAWEDITPDIIEMNGGIRGIAFADSTVYLGVDWGLGTPCAVRGRMRRK